MAKLPAILPSSAEIVGSPVGAPKVASCTCVSPKWTNTRMTKKLDIRQTRMAVANGLFVYLRDMTGLIFKLF